MDPVEAQCSHGCSCCNTCTNDLAFSDLAYKLVECIESYVLSFLDTCHLFDSYGMHLVTTRRDAGRPVYQNTI
jgi:hypothetical protein